MSHTFQQFSPTDHFGWHSAYLEVYQRVFKSLQDTEMDVLEIGTDGGGGLEMYADWFNNARIVGMDISPVPRHIVGHKRIIHIQQDAYSPTAIDMLRKMKFAVIIDDGPHTVESQEFFVQNYPKLLTFDGVAVVEDVQDIAHIDRLHAALPEGFFGYCVDLRRINQRYDDLLYFIHRK